VAIRGMPLHQCFLSIGLKLNWKQVGTPLRTCKKYADSTDSSLFRIFKLYQKAVKNKTCSEPQCSRKIYSYEKKIS
jgi:hypothetical protein